MKTAPFRLSLRVIPFVAVLFAACAQEPALLPDDLLADHQAFVAVPDESGADGGTLAIRKDVLARPSFQVRDGKLFVFDDSSPGGSSTLAASSDALAAYPLVDLASFKALPGSDLYILIRRP